MHLMQGLQIFAVANALVLKSLMLSQSVPSLPHINQQPPVLNQQLTLRDLLLMILYNSLLTKASQQACLKKSGMKLFRTTFQSSKMKQKKPRVS